MSEISKELQELIDNQNKRLNQLETALTGVNKENADLKKKVAASDNSDVLGQQVQRMNELQTAVDSLAKENSALKNLATKKADAPQEKPEIPTKSFKCSEGKEWKFIVPVFNYNGDRITAKDALTDKTILQALVDMRSGVIAQVK